MERRYPVEYRPPFTTQWVWIAIFSWVIIVFINIIVGLYADSMLWSVVAAGTGVAWIIMSLIIVLTRRLQRGEAQLQDGYVLVWEFAPWWRRVSLRGRLRLRVVAVDRPDARTVVITGDDAFWGTVRVWFTSTREQEGQELYQALTRARGTAS